MPDRQHEAGTWAELNQDARRRLFVGREPECARFGDFLADRARRMLHVHGPGGIGKTALVHRWLEVASASGAECVYIDGREVPVEPEALVALLATPRTGEGTRVVALDDFQRFAQLVTWLRRELLPSLPVRTLLVTAGREPLAQAWRQDASVSELVVELALGGLAPEAARDYLARRAVPDTTSEAVVTFAAGHPLALRVAAEVALEAPEAEFDFDKARRALRPVFEEYLGGIPSPLCRRALQAAGIVRHTTEAALEAMLELPDASELFEWLASRPFVEPRTEGVAPHDLVRDLLNQDLAWRNPDLATRLTRRAGEYFLGRLANPGTARFEAVFEDFMYVFRHTPAGQLVTQSSELSGCYVDAARAEDRDEFLAMVRRHEGEQAVAVATWWMEREPEGLVAVRSASTPLEGFLLYVQVHAGEQRPEAAAVDPGFLALTRYLSAAPLRAGETACLCRFLMCREAHQGSCPAQITLFSDLWRRMYFAGEVCTGLAVFADPAHWLQRPDRAVGHFPEMDFELGGRPYGIFGFDWRVTRRDEQLRRLIELMLAPRSTSADPPAAATILDEERFRASLRHVVRHFTRPDRLVDSPLLRSRLVAERLAALDAPVTAGGHHTEQAWVARSGAEAPPERRVEVLREILREAWQELASAPGTTRHAEVLRRAYFEPAVKGLVAAAELGLPFSTYRYYVSQGTALLAEKLWQREVVRP